MEPLLQSGSQVQHAYVVARSIGRRKTVGASITMAGRGSEPEANQLDFLLGLKPPALARNPAISLWSGWTFYSVTPAHRHHGIPDPGWQSVSVAHDRLFRRHGRELVHRHKTECRVGQHDAGRRHRQGRCQRRAARRAFGSWRLKQNLFCRVPMSAQENKPNLAIRLVCVSGFSV